MTGPTLSPGGASYQKGSMVPFTHEVFQQCFAATEAWNRVEGRLAVPPGDLRGHMMAALQIVADLQAFAFASGILSDLFFPSGAGDRDRGAQLGKLYGVGDDSPLINAKIKVRHSLAHIDRDLDRWLLGQEGKQIGPLTIAPWEGDAPPLTSTVFARTIDNVHWRLFVLGESLEFIPLLQEIGRISTQYPLEFGGIRLEISPVQ